MWCGRRWSTLVTPLKSLPLGDLNGKDQDIANYAFTLVQAPQAQEGFLWLGYGDYAKVWLNGDVVYENIARRNFQLADQKVPIHLVQGENKLLFKIGNSAGNTMLAAHVVDQDGDRLPGIEFLLPGEIPTAVEESTASQPLPEAPAAAGELPESIQSHHPHSLCPAPSRFCQAGYLQCGGPVDLHPSGRRRRLGLSRGNVGREQCLGLQRGQRNLLRRPQGRRPAQDPTHDPGPLSVSFTAPFRRENDSNPLPRPDATALAGRQHCRALPAGYLHAARLGKFWDLAAQLWYFVVLGCLVQHPRLGATCQRLGSVARSSNEPTAPLWHPPCWPLISPLCTFAAIPVAGRLINMAYQPHPWWPLSWPRR